MAGTLIVSLDYELFWGMTDCCTLASYEANVRGGKQAIPQLLELFERYGIHATWAAVGYLFADGKEEAYAFAPPADLRPHYADPMKDTYRMLDAIGKDETEAPCFFAPAILPMIAKTPHQEIASHTFSHFYCREEGQTPPLFRADMEASLKIAQQHGYTLTSAILPRNQCEETMTTVLGELGFTAYRDEEHDWIHKKIKWRPLMRLLRLADVYVPLTGQGGYRPQKDQGVWNLIGSRMYKPILSPLRLLEGLKIHRIKKQMLHAAQNGLVFHLWWHPHNIGVRTEEHLKQLEEIFRYFEELKETYQMESLNMSEMVSRLNGQD